jgi:hypothetical protein
LFGAANGIRTNRLLSSVMETSLSDDTDGRVNDDINGSKANTQLLTMTQSEYFCILPPIARDPFCNRAVRPPKRRAVVGPNAIAEQPTELGVSV